MAFYELENDLLGVSVNELGAELSSLRDSEGRELLWQGGEAWGRRAPVLFPIVGRLPDDRLTVDGQQYTMTQHGFARDLPFTVERPHDASLTFTLVDDERTREQFPFPFVLQLRYSLSGSTLRVSYRLENPGEATLHASLGAHPGFRWPLPGAESRNSHTIEFERDEPAPIRRLVGGLLLPQDFSTPVAGNTLALQESLFDADAVIFDRVESRSVRYTAPGAPVITVSFPDFPILGVWSKAPGEFVCIEPWFGMTSPIGFDADFSQKPGQLALEPGESRELTLEISLQR
ncbi:aldose 1-epimerase family protein [Parafrigoribacterium soli]|uniref:aldose 1-epimerase family protein n=1 Tax=Parafrigoribacterium soli TaxID=3144663 RepID=UPI0032EDFB56